MRLLQTNDGHTFSLTNDFINDEMVPKYAILSHTWEPGGQEVTMEDLVNDNKNSLTKMRASFRRLRPRSSKSGYAKLRFCAQQAKRDGLRYFWVDTCCIDKNNLPELQRSINSMFRWYRDAAKCYVYLSDVSKASYHENFESPAWLPDFLHSRWFTRGWTLQELLAPSVVEFFSKEGVRLGDRSELRRYIHEITKIPLTALSGAALSEFSVDERLSWVLGRQTTCKEDKAYSMFGIFNIHLPLIYGEGFDGAWKRLKEKIAESQKDTSGHEFIEGRVPQSTVPFRRDDNFVSRDGLNTIHQLCKRPAARAALVGLGGVGKSQMAVEYTYQMLDESPSSWVFWVHAETKASLRDGYRKIAEAVKMVGWDNEKVDYMRLVRTWLCDGSNGRWVMVVDNADDSSVFFDKTVNDDSDSPLAEPFVNFLPQAATGSILFTSRSLDVAYKLTGSKNSVVEVGPMNEKEALALLQKKCDFTVKVEDAISLSNALDFMPLALTQAAAFINQRGPRMSIAKYVKQVRKGNHDRIHLLSRDVGDNRRDANASNSIITTWQISFAYIQKQTPSAARLLSLMSLFDRMNIPDTLLQGQYGEESGGEVNFEDDIYTLISFSLVKPSADGSCFDMHALVQFSMMEWLRLSDELEHWKEVHVALIEEKYPIGQPETWPVCQSLTPHAQAALDKIPVDADALEVWASLAFKVAWYVSDMGDHSRANKLARDSFDVREILLGAEDLLTLDSLNTLALTLHQIGRNDEAKALHLKGLEAKIRTLGSDSTDTLCTMFNLALLYNDECQWADAEKLLTKALEISTRTLGPDDPWTLNAQMHLASTYRHQCRWADATKIELQILNKREMTLRKDHPLTLVVKSNLACTYREQGRLKDAERIQLQILESCTANPGSEAKLLAHKAQLALTYKAQGRWGEAERLQLEALDASRRKLGPEHFATGNRMSQLSSTYWNQGRFEDALDLDLRLLDIQTRNLGDQHLSTLDTKGGLARTYRSLGLFEKAEELCIEVLKHHKNKLGENHPQTLYSKSCLAGTYADQGRWSEAEELAIYVFKTSTDILGPEHLKTLSNMSILAVMYERQGRMVEALELMEECSQTYQRLGTEHIGATWCRETCEIWRLRIEQAQE